MARSAHPSRLLVLASAAALLLSSIAGAAGADGASLAVDAADYARLAEMPPGASVTVTGLAGPGGDVRLRLRRFDVLAPEAAVVRVDADGRAHPLMPSVVLLRGRVEGVEGSRAFLGVSPWGVQGYIETEAGLHLVSTGPFAGAAGDVLEARLTAASALPAPDAPPCGVNVADDRFFPAGRSAPAGGAAAVGGPPCRIANIAVDSDWEFTGGLFGGDAQASAAYALTLMAAVSEIFSVDLNVRLRVTFLRVWEADVDPYDPNDPNDLLDQFRIHWAQNMAGVARRTAHLLSGRQDLPYGGVAYLSVLCNYQHGYAVSGHLNGNFPYPLQDHDGGNWDLVVVAHELGHNFGTQHTHDGYTPPIDNCGNGDCAGAENGTIMSYCHTCPGGIANIQLAFHPLVVNRILNYLDSFQVGCNMISSTVMALDDEAVTYSGVPVTVDVLMNDLTASCGPVVLESFDAVTALGGEVTLVPADGSFTRDRLAYAPPPGGSGLDSFSYVLDGGLAANVAVDLQPLRAPDATGVVEPGVAVDYYALSAPSVLPDFEALAPYASDVVNDIDHPSTNGVFLTSGRSDEVGAVFRGFVEVPAAGLWTFYVESDDGSRMFIGDEVVVNNDGLHGMQERSGLIALQAGRHATRVEFFENGGGAGVIVRHEGPTVLKQVVAPEQWTHGVPGCTADISGGDGNVDSLDFLELIAQWGSPCGGTCSADITGPLPGVPDGNVDALDLLVLIAQWGSPAECP